MSRFWYTASSLSPHTTGLQRRAARRAGCRSSRCAPAGRSSSRAACGGSGCAPCIAWRRRCGGCRSSVALDSAKSMMRDLQPKARRAWHAGRSAPSGGCRGPGQHIGHGITRQRPAPAVFGHSRSSLGFVFCQSSMKYKVESGGGKVTFALHGRLPHAWVRPRPSTPPMLPMPLPP